MNKCNFLAFEEKYKYLESVYHEYTSLKSYYNKSEVENPRERNGPESAKLPIFTLFNLIHEALRLEKEISDVFTSEVLQAFNDFNANVEDACQTADLFLNVSILKQNLLVEFELSITTEVLISHQLSNDEQTSNRSAQNEYWKGSPELFENLEDKNGSNFDDLAQYIQELHDRVLEVIACQKEQLRQRAREAVLKEDIGKNYRILLKNLETLLKPEKSNNTNRPRQIIVPFWKRGQFERLPNEMDRCATPTAQNAKTPESSTVKLITDAPQGHVPSHSEVKCCDEHGGVIHKQSIYELLTNLQKTILQAELSEDVYNARERPLIDRSKCAKTKPPRPPPPKIQVTNTTESRGRDAQGVVEPRQREIRIESVPHSLYPTVEIVNPQDSSKQDTSDASTVYVVPTASQTIPKKGNCENRALECCLEMLERLDGLRQNFTERVALLVDLCERMETQRDDWQLSYSVMARENVNSANQSSTGTGTKDNQVNPLATFKSSIPISTKEKSTSLGRSNITSVDSGSRASVGMTTSSSVTQNLPRQPSLEKDKPKVFTKVSDRNYAFQEAATTPNRSFCWPTSSHSRQMFGKAKTFMSPYAPSTQRGLKMFSSQESNRTCAKNNKESGVDAAYLAVNNENSSSFQNSSEFRVLEGIPKVPPSTSSHNGNRTWPPLIHKNVPYRYDMMSQVKRLSTIVEPDTPRSSLQNSPIEQASSNALALNNAIESSTSQSMYTLPDVHDEEAHQQSQNERNYLRVSQISELNHTVDRSLDKKSNISEVWKERTDANPQTNLKKKLHVIISSYLNNPKYVSPAKLKNAKHNCATRVENTTTGAHDSNGISDVSLISMKHANRSTEKSVLDKARTSTPTKYLTSGTVSTLDDLSNENIVVTNRSVEVHVPNVSSFR